MEEQKMYKELAKYYDLIYSFKDYEQEAKRVMELIGSYKKLSGDELLGVGCGSGKHLEYFKENYL